MTAHLAGYTAESLARNPLHFGGLLETFVVAELRKQAGWSEARVSLFHYRTTTGREVDVVLEDAAGRLVGIEVKASHSVTAKDFAGLDALQQDASGRLQMAVVLYAGERAISFGSAKLAMPISALWRYTPTAASGAK